MEARRLKVTKSLDNKPKEKSIWKNRARGKAEPSEVNSTGPRAKPIGKPIARGPLGEEEPPISFKLHAFMYSCVMLDFV
jgi:hypothetical protein